MFESSLTIVIPAYNEEQALPVCAERTLRFLRERVRDGELILVNDGSSDGTGETIDRLAVAHKDVKAQHLDTNSGMGAALLVGYAAATKEWVTMLPADGQIDAFELDALLGVADRFDVVTTFYSNRSYSLFRKCLSWGFRAATVLIVGSRGGNEGTYLCRRELFRRLAPVSHSFLLNLEIPIRARRAGLRVGAVTIRVGDRTAGTSKAVAGRRILHTFGELFRLRRLLSKERA